MQDRFQKQTGLYLRSISLNGPACRSRPSPCSTSQRRSTSPSYLLCHRSGTASGQWWCQTAFRRAPGTGARVSRYPVETARTGSSTPGCPGCPAPSKTTAYRPDGYQCLRCRVACPDSKEQHKRMCRASACPTSCPSKSFRSCSYRRSPEARSTACARCPRRYALVAARSASGSCPSRLRAC